MVDGWVEQGYRGISDKLADSGMKISRDVTLLLAGKGHINEVSLTRRNSWMDDHPSALGRARVVEGLGLNGYASVRVVPALLSSARCQGRGVVRTATSASGRLLG